MQSKETSYWLISKLLEWKFGPNFQRNFGLAAWNENPKPFVWTATVESIVKNYRAVDKLWNKFGPAVPYPDGEKRNVDWPVIYRTLH